jgi:hypothetical protein
MPLRGRHGGRRHKHAVPRRGVQRGVPPWSGDVHRRQRQAARRRGHQPPRQRGAAPRQHLHRRLPGACGQGSRKVVTASSKVGAPCKDPNPGSVLLRSCHCTTQHVQNSSDATCEMSISGVNGSACTMLQRTSKDEAGAVNDGGGQRLLQRAAAAVQRDSVPAQPGSVLD